MKRIDLSGELIYNVFLLPFDNDNKSFDKLLLCLSNDLLSIEVNADCDELIICLHKKDTYEIDTNYVTPDWAYKIVGKRIITNWLAQNHNEYLDLFALAVGLFIPNVIISCAASQLSISIIES